MSKCLNLKADFRDQNFKIDFLNMAKTEIPVVQYNFLATIYLA